MREISKWNGTLKQIKPRFEPFALPPTKGNAIWASKKLSRTRRHLYSGSSGYGPPGIHTFRDMDFRISDFSSRVTDENSGYVLYEWVPALAQQSLASLIEFHTVLFINFSVIWTSFETFLVIIGQSIELSYKCFHFALYDAAEYLCHCFISTRLTCTKFNKKFFHAS